MEKKIAWETYKAKDVKAAEKFATEYIDFISVGKTERECVKLSVEMAKAAGYKDLSEVVKKKGKLKAGDKVYQVWMKKSIALFNIGSDPIEDGMAILGAHIDSPRMDVKQNPLFEDGGMAYLDTHYYGGIKKYQWVTVPLAIHGVVAKKDGSVIDITIGEDEADPVFCVTDILIHLAGDQMDKKASKAIEGEQLDILFGSKPLAGKEKDAVKENILKILKDKYDFEEEDFESAELEITPAGRARFAGLDKSLILAYGQDDKVCAYPSLVAMLNVKNVKKTSCCLLVDKEEIGSVGATGMRSKFFENAVAEIIDRMGNYSELILKRCLANSMMLSSDVTAGYDPEFASCFEKKNVAYMGKGVAFSKFTGSRGKSGSNDANAEYMAKIRAIMEKGKVNYQTAELGKVDVGGGGTIAYILALYGMDVIDCGVPVLCMHAPWEVTSVADVYEAYKAYVAFISY